MVKRQYSAFIMDPGWYFVTTHSFADYAFEVGLSGACVLEKVLVEAVVLLAFVGSR